MGNETGRGMTGKPTDDDVRQSREQYDNMRLDHPEKGMAPYAELDEPQRRKIAKAFAEANRTGVAKGTQMLEDEIENLVRRRCEAVPTGSATWTAYSNWMVPQSHDDAPDGSIMMCVAPAEDGSGWVGVLCVADGGRDMQEVYGATATCRSTLIAALERAYDRQAWETRH